MRFSVFFLLGFVWFAQANASAQGVPAAQVLGRSREGVVVRYGPSSGSVVCVFRDDGSHRCSNDAERSRLRLARFALGSGAAMLVLAAKSVAIGAIAGTCQHYEDPCVDRNRGVYVAIPFAVGSAALFSLGSVLRHRFYRDYRSAFEVVGWSDPNGLAFGRGLALRGTY